MISRYLRTMEKDRVTAVFHALEPLPFFVPSWAWQEQGQQIQELLKDTGLLIEDNQQDDEFADQIKADLMDGVMSILYLLLTKDCNFRCRQCFQEERHRHCGKLPFMTKEIAKRGIDIFAKHIQKTNNGLMEVQMELYGGEPLLNWPVLQYAVNYFEKLQTEGQLPKKSTISIVSNGSLVNEEIVSFMARHNISVGISLDGWKEKNDEYRIDRLGRGTYDRILETVRMLQRAHDLSLSLSITINPNLADCLPELVAWAKELNIDAIGFNLIGGKSYDYTETSILRDAYREKTTTGLVKAFEIAKEIGISEDRMNRKISKFIAHDFLGVDCGAIGNQMVIQPDGAIGYCHADEKYNIGSVFDNNFDLSDCSAIEKWKRALPIFNERCQQCEAIAICGYGCFHNTIEEGRAVEELDRQFCLHTKKAMDFLVWRLYDQAR